MLSLGTYGWIQGTIVRIGASGCVKMDQPIRYYTHVDDTNEIRRYRPIKSELGLSKYHRNEMIKHRDIPNGININNKFKRFIGLPLNILINKNNNLTDFINKYLINSKDFIMTIYRVKYGNVKNKLISISKNKRNAYKPYNEFIKKYPN